MPVPGPRAVLPTSLQARCLLQPSSPLPGLAATGAATVMSHDTCLCAVSFHLQETRPSLRRRAPPPRFSVRRLRPRENLPARGTRPGGTVLGFKPRGSCHNWVLLPHAPGLPGSRGEAIDGKPVTRCEAHSRAGRTGKRGWLQCRKAVGGLGTWWGCGLGPHQVGC